MNETEIHAHAYHYRFSQLFAHSLRKHAHICTFTSMHMPICMHTLTDTAELALNSVFDKFFAEVGKSADTDSSVSLWFCIYVRVPVLSAKEFETSRI